MPSFSAKLKLLRSGRTSPTAGALNVASAVTARFTLGERFTVVKDLKKELGPGLLADMCEQLDIRKEDL